ncbi:MAG TPA: ABC transporter permease [Solirubrobacterales bacterium]|nr:ABC transporter permease [Solirubrobacterales bacterium]
MGLADRTSMASLIGTNMLRHKARTLATAAGIGLGVGTIVALLSVGAGLSNAADQLVHLGRADLGIFQSGVEDPTASLLPVSLARRLEARPDVARATPMLLVVGEIEASPAAIAFGVDPRGFVDKRLVLTSGSRKLGRHSVLVGDRLADELHLHPGSTLVIRHHPFTVTGVYHSGVYFQDSGATLALGVAQRLTARQGEATTVAVQLADGVQEKSAEAAIRRDFPGTTVIGASDDPSRIGTGGQLVRTAVDVIAALALIVGGLGVSNTMAMAVLERESELALLGAVGWRRRRIASLVLGEGVATSVIGAGAGLLFGIFAARFLSDALGVGAVVTPELTPVTIAEALLIGMAIGVLGGLYPAWRAVRVPASRLLGG